MIPMIQAAMTEAAKHDTQARATPPPHVHTPARPSQDSAPPTCPVLPQAWSPIPRPRTPSADLALRLATVAPSTRQPIPFPLFLVSDLAVRLSLVSAWLDEAARRREARHDHLGQSELPRPGDAGTHAHAGGSHEQARTAGVRVRGWRCL
jgi:hypothetical protein